MAVATRDYGLWIDGAFVDAEEVRELHEPASGELLARAPLASNDDVDRAVTAARAAAPGRRHRRRSVRACCTRWRTRSSPTGRSWPSSSRATSAKPSRR